MLSNAFERVYVLNLASRPERWRAFCARRPVDWPFRPPTRANALDGRLVPPPTWWRSGPGAWGCYRSHLSLLEDCLNKNVGSVLLMEDDAMLVPGFREKAELFFSHLPDDWSFVYLGGEHLKTNIRLPRKVNDWVYRPFNVNRTHCFGLRGRAMMELAYRHLNAFQAWTADHHIDHHLGSLHAAMEQGLYAPREWLVQQQGGQSDVNGKAWPALEFAGAEALTRPVVDLKMVAVLGPYCSGASCVAGMLHHAGINMGSVFPAATSSDPLGCFEADGLASICRMAFREPWLAEEVCREDRAALLRKWAGDRSNQLRGQSKFAGGNHPSLCLLGPELMEAWNRPLFVVVDRPVEESMQAVARANWNWPKEAIGYSLPMMVAKREQFLRECAPPHVRIQLNHLLANPGLALDQICGALGYSPTEQQRREATEFVAQWAASQGLRASGPQIRQATEAANSSSQPLPGPFVACLGLHRSGSSCVAGVLHRLGVHMGNRFVGCEADGGYEAEGLASICERYMPFPGLEKRLGDNAVASLLAAWISERQREATAKGTIAGGKYPHLSAMGDMLLKSCGDSLYVVHCERPFKESIASLIRRDGARHEHKRLEAVQKLLWQEKQRFLAIPGLKIHTVDYRSLLADPTSEVKKLASFLPFEMDGRAIDEAASYVKPKLRHVALAS